MLTGPLAATLFLTIGLNIISLRSSAQKFKGGTIVFTETTGGTGDSSRGGSPKIILVCQNNVCHLSSFGGNNKLKNDFPKAHISFKATRNIRKNETFTIYVEVDSASCPCAK